jgi:hypothetical protein
MNEELSSPGGAGVFAAYSRFTLSHREFEKELNAFAASYCRGRLGRRFLAGFGSTSSSQKTTALQNYFRQVNQRYLVDTSYYQMVLDQVQEAIDLADTFRVEYHQDTNSGGAAETLEMCLTVEGTRMLLARLNPTRLGQTCDSIPSRPVMELIKEVNSQEKIERALSRPPQFKPLGKDTQISCRQTGMILKTVLSFRRRVSKPANV